MAHASLSDLKNIVLQRVSLQELVGRFHKLEKRGSNYATCCPFHGEKTPSFYIYDQRFFCFGCKISGDVFDFIKHREGTDFKGALLYLADLYGITVHPDTLGRNSAVSLSPARGEGSSWRDSLVAVGKEKKGLDRTRAFRLVQAASQYYCSQLGSCSEGRVARDYFLSRGFTLAFSEQQAIGYAPTQGLIKHLRKLGAIDDEMISLSLGGRRDQDGSLYDFFRGRLMIPISDQWGRVVAFGGRSLEKDQEPKYLNSKDTAFFKKGKTLFGFFHAKPFIRGSKEVIIVEGYMDALKLWSFGFNNCVAVLGTALTEDHLKILKPLGAKISLLYDGDSAGSKASVASALAAISFGGIDVQVGRIPEGEDPDTFITTQGQPALKALLSQTLAAEDFLFEHLLQNHLNENSSVLPLIDVIQTEIFPWLGNVNDPLKKGYLLARLSEKTGIKLSDLEGSLRNFRSLSRRQSEFSQKQNEGRTFQAQELTGQPSYLGKPGQFKTPSQQVQVASLKNNNNEIDQGRTFKQHDAPHPAFRSRHAGEKISEGASMLRDDGESRGSASSESMLSQSEMEILGHLFFLSPLELKEKAQISAWREMKPELLPGHWGMLYSCWMEKLNNNVSPLDQPYEVGAIKANETVLAFIERLRSMEKAFSHEGRQKRLERLFISDQLRDLKRELSRLKRNLEPKQNTNSELEGQILTQMSLLSKRIAETQRMLQSLR